MEHYYRPKTKRQYMGLLGEDEAVKLLEGLNYKILRRNYAIHNIGEIDIIAEKDGDIHICEVRARLNTGDFPDSTESVTPKKRNRILRTAEYYIAEENLYDRYMVFEVIKVTHDKQGNVLSVQIVPF